MGLPCPAVWDTDSKVWIVGIHFKIQVGQQEVAFLERVSIKAGLVAGSFVFVTILLANNLFPDGNRLVIAIAVGLSASVGVIVGNKLFRKEQ